MSDRKIFGLFITLLLTTAMAYNHASEMDEGVIIERNSNVPLSIDGKTACTLRVPEFVENGEVIDATIYWDYAPPGERRLMFVFNWNGQWEDWGGKTAVIRELNSGSVSYGHLVEVIVPGPAYAWQTATVSATVTGVINCHATAEMIVLLPY